MTHIHLVAGHTLSSRVIGDYYNKTGDDGVLVPVDTERRGQM